MPIPFLAIGAVAAAAHLVMTGHSTWKQRKWEKVHDERLAELHGGPRRSRGNSQPIAGGRGVPGESKNSGLPRPGHRGRKSELVSHFSFYSTFRLRALGARQCEDYHPQPGHCLRPAGIHPGMPARRPEFARRRG